MSPSQPRSRPALRWLALAGLVAALAWVGLAVRDRPAPLPTITSFDEAPLRQWAWLPLEASRCADGSPNGIGINRGPVDDAVIVLQGGGACWDHASCYEDELAIHIDGGFSAEDLAELRHDLDAGELFDREPHDNPTREWTYVFVPYCTGDMHAGSVVAEHGGRTTHHAGRANIEAMLGAVAPSLRDAERIVLAGSSAGGFGAVFNHARVAEAFPSARVDLIDDGGPPLPRPHAPTEPMRTWISAWGLLAAAPPGCDDCDTDLSGYLRASFDAHPRARFALLSYAQDRVIGRYFGIDGATVAEGLEALRTDDFGPALNAHVLVAPGSEHTMFGHLREVRAGRTDAWSWIVAMLEDDPAWSDAP